ncbi:hypothetical protein [Leptothoe kymatousa]|uniref:Uncharacterized protein n=1 Tax=Leptothoe kymatousa TAU-MAC 1615 TaxID=2364775 RepID=A0ABS5Y4Y5_9CYAN|nr:hypothetical protein [Leptothoe kymatousa]MBT9312419.1 hypothetical protein [Leptothoe kymatousa TAU-MAC 1615]
MVWIIFYTICAVSSVFAFFYAAFGLTEHLKAANKLDFNHSKRGNYNNGVPVVPSNTYQYNEDYIGDQYNTIVPASIREATLQSGLEGFIEAELVRFGARSNGEFKVLYSDSNLSKLGIVLETLLGKDTIHFYVEKDDFVRAKEREREDSLISKLEDLKESHPNIIIDKGSIEREKEAIQSSSTSSKGGELLGRFLQEKYEHSKIRECFIENHEFEVIGFRNEGNNGFLVSERQNDDYSVEIKLLKDTLTASGKSLLKDDINSYSKFNVYGKIGPIDKEEKIITVEAYAVF